MCNYKKQLLRLVVVIVQCSQLIVAHSLLFIATVQTHIQQPVDLFCYLQLGQDSVPMFFSLLSSPFNEQSL